MRQLGPGYPSPHLTGATFFLVSIAARQKAPESRFSAFCPSRLLSCSFFIKNFLWGSVAFVEHKEWGHEKSGEPYKFEPAFTG